MGLNFKIIQKVYCDNIPKVLAEGWAAAKFDLILPDHLYWFWEYWEFETEVFSTLHSMADLVAMNHYICRMDYDEVPPCDLNQLSFCMNTNYHYCDTISFFACGGTKAFHILGHTLEFFCDWDNFYNPPANRADISDLFEDWYAFLQAKSMQTKDFYQLLLNNAMESLHYCEQNFKEMPAQYHEILLFKNMILEALEAQ